MVVTKFAFLQSGDMFHGFPANPHDANNQSDATRKYGHLTAVTKTGSVISAHQKVSLKREPQDIISFISLS